MVRGLLLESRLRDSVAHASTCYPDKCTPEPVDLALTGPWPNVEVTYALSRHFGSTVRNSANPNVLQATHAICTTIHQLAAAQEYIGQQS